MITDGNLFGKKEVKKEMFGETSPQAHPTCHNLSYTHRKISNFSKIITQRLHEYFIVGAETRVVTLTDDRYVSVETVANFCIVVFTRERCETKEVVRRDVEGALEMCMSCCMREAMETAQSPGDDAHAVGIRPKWARSRTTLSVIQCVCGLRAWPIDMCAQTRTRANVNIRPRPLAQRTGKKKKRIRESEKERKRERWKETNRQRDKERKREGREKERQREEWPPSDFSTEFTLS